MHENPEKMCNPIREKKTEETQKERTINRVKVYKLYFNMQTLIEANPQTETVQTYMSKQKPKQN